MKTYILIAFSFFSLALFCAAGEQHTIMGEMGKVQGFLKYKGVHSDIEVVALSNDIGSGWHKEDLTVYVRDKKNSRRFRRELVVPMGKNIYREFRCKKDEMTLLIESRSGKEQKFRVFCVYQLPTSTEQDSAHQSTTRSESKSK